MVVGPFALPAVVKVRTDCALVTDSHEGGTRTAVALDIVMDNFGALVELHIRSHECLKLRIA